MPQKAGAAAAAATRLVNAGGTQRGTESAPRRHFGALAGHVRIAPDFDAPLEIDDATQHTRAEPIADYNTDIARWAEDQAARLRTGNVSEMDRENIAEELDSLARALRRELVERLARLLQNLLQWEYLDGLRVPAWYTAIQEERSMIPRLLEDAPSLDQNGPEVYA
jgi:hypothetical protein